MPAWAKALVARQDAFEQRLDQNIARLDDQLATLTRETKAAESAIAQALKLLQAQVMSKAARGGAAAWPLARRGGCDRRAGAVASRGVEPRCNCVRGGQPSAAQGARAIGDEHAVAACRKRERRASGPILHAKRITAQPESALMPTHCLSWSSRCQRTSHYSPPHEDCLPPSRTQPVARPGSVFWPANPDARPRLWVLRLAPRCRSRPWRRCRCRHPHRKVVPHDGLVEAGRRRFDAEPQANLRSAPANETRKQTQLQLHMLAANRTAGCIRARRRRRRRRRGGAGGGRARPSTAKGERFGRVEAVVGRQPSRPTSAAALLPGQSRSVRGGVRASASAGNLGVVSRRVLVR